jgi:hypothetical protein
MVAERLLATPCANEDEREEQTAWKVGYFLPIQHKEAVQQILSGNLPTADSVAA